MPGNLPNSAKDPAGNIRFRAGFGPKTKPNQAQNSRHGAHGPAHNDSWPIPACFDDDPKLRNCEIAQSSKGAGSNFWGPKCASSPPTQGAMSKISDPPFGRRSPRTKIGSKVGIHIWILPLRRSLLKREHYRNIKI